MTDKVILTIDCETNTVTCEPAGLEDDPFNSQHQSKTSRALLIAYLLRPHVVKLMKLSTPALQRRRIATLKAATTIPTEVSYGTDKSATSAR